MTAELDEETKRAERAAGANPDPITGELGSHLVGTATGSAGAAAAGALAGAAIGGPVGAVVCGVAGAVIGAGVKDGPGLRASRAVSSRDVGPKATEKTEGSPSPSRLLR